jgi:hypothetical protein
MPFISQQQVAQFMLREDFDKNMEQELGVTFDNVARFKVEEDGKIVADSYSSFEGKHWSFSVDTDGYLHKSLECESLSGPYNPDPTKPRQVSPSCTPLADTVLNQSNPFSEAKLQKAREMILNFDETFDARVDEIASKPWGEMEL